MNDFSESSFQKLLDGALSTVRTILNNTRSPQHPTEVPHTYEDKFHLVESLSNTTLAAFMNALEAAGLNSTDVFRRSSDRMVYLRFTCEERCTYRTKVERKVESPELVTQKSGTFGSFTSTLKTVTKVTDYIWQFSTKYQLFAFSGNDPKDKVVLRERTGECEIVTASDLAPKPMTKLTSSTDLNITWLRQHTRGDRTINFKIDRTVKSCQTPRRNLEVDTALHFCTEFYSWAKWVVEYFRHLFSVQFNHGLDLSKINSTEIFVPLVPLFEEVDDRIIQHR
eukprot:TRINITY_DN5329_c0_g2_i4.p1 TRINITY_DN5329_c0_g2~~TRINITY_DN5329_c0_g2_i4.p1  ORF type:complete len:281 (+),score=35.53 TRINITY_DN5329_c0_g2_i4:83-925(+)